MRIAYTIPSIARHGGMRIMFEHLNRLLEFGHEVVAYYPRRGKPDWFQIHPHVQWEWNYEKLRGVDVLVITSPHTIDMVRKINAKKTFLFCQMAEHLFRPHDRKWQAQCRNFYIAPFPMLSISKWNIEMFEKQFGRTAPTHYIGNGVNVQDFPIDSSVKDGKTVLVEGWECSNPSKDVDHVAPNVARRLKDEGYTILAYGALPIKVLPSVPDEYHEKPDMKTLNELYSRATILLKASKYDARACAPVEAMTKATVTARAIIEGDDDLIHGVNCLRSEYSFDGLYASAKSLLESPDLRGELSAACWTTLPRWEKIMPSINQILTS